MKANNPIQVARKKAIINFEGIDFQRQIGVDSRIIDYLSKVGIKTSFFVDEAYSEDAVYCLKREFQKKITQGVIQSMYPINHLAMISFVSLNYREVLSELHRIKVYPLLFNHSEFTGKVCLVVTDNQVEIAQKCIVNEFVKNVALWNFLK